ncbi:hypothetical protein HS125_14620 [bacterium]|nr:hypothetical protein [bacterium]
MSGGRWCATRRTARPATHGSLRRGGHSRRKASGAAAGRLSLQTGLTPRRAAGRKLVALECFTWLDEHFQVSLSRVRVALENYFLSGVNHVFYHGIPYSPAEAPFPGWLFYASTHFGESNSFAEHLPNLHRFIARCQSFLQAGEPDNPVLLYLPIYDLWAVDRGSSDLLQFATVHNADHWLKTNLAPTYAASRRLWDEGFGFDYVSDRALVEMAKGRPAARYRAIVVAGCERMPPATLEALLALARAGMNVLFVDRPPRTAPGWKDWQARERKLSARLEELSWTAYEGQAGIRRARVGAGGVLVGEDLTTLLSYSGVPREALRDTGLEFARRRDGDSVIYYLANRTEQSFDDWLPLACTGEAAILFDPLHEAAGLATTRKDADGRLEVRLQLPAEQSIIARVLPRRVAGAAWVYCRLGGPMPLQTAGWRVQFTTGGPALPPDWTTLELKSWTEGSDAAMRDFSGTARYETAFVAPATPADGWMLDLGEVCDSARVYLNGQRVGDLWCKPFRIELSPHLRPGENRLTIEVANLLANRIAAMDRAGVAWRKFFFVNINYRPFDAADWPPRPSGLLGPVSLIPYMRATP